MYLIKEEKYDRNGSYMIRSWDHSIRNIHNTRRKSRHISFQKFKDLIIWEEK